MTTTVPPTASSKAAPAPTLPSPVSILAAQAAWLRSATAAWTGSVHAALAVASAPWVPVNVPHVHGPAAEKIEGSPEALVVGFETAFTRRVTAELIEAFGEVSGDESRLHYDDEYAAKTRFGGRIAHGLLCGAFVSAALSRIPGVVVYLSQDLRFKAPVRIGDEVTARVRVVERPEGKAWARVETKCTLADGTVVVEGDAKILVEDEPSV